MQNQTRLKVISWNINGLKEKLKDAKKTEKLQEMFHNYDIVLLQETHLGKKNENEKKLGTKLEGEKESANKEEDEDEDEEAMSAGDEENQTDSENQDEDEEVMNPGNEENQTDSENQDEDEDEEAMNAGNEENQTDTENQDEEKVNDFFKKCGYCIVEKLQNQSVQDHQDSKKPTVYIANLSSKSRGVAILVNKAHKCLKTFCKAGDYAWVYVEIDNQKYTFVSVYYHSKESSNLMLRIVCSFLTQGSEVFQMPVIGGDFNTTLHCRLDKNSPKDSAVHKTRRKSILEIMKTLDLQDVWRKKHPDKKVYTYSCKNPMSRLDYVFMLKKDLPCVQKCEIWQDKHIVPELSDHYPIKLTLTMKH